MALSLLAREGRRWRSLSSVGPVTASLTAQAYEGGGRSLVEHWWHRQLTQQAGVTSHLHLLAQTGDPHPLWPTISAPACLLLDLQHALNIQVQVTLTVEEAAPSFKGETVAASYKPAVLAGGLRVKVPPFVQARTASLCLGVRLGSIGSVRACALLAGGLRAKVPPFVHASASLSVCWGLVVQRCESLCSPPTA